MNCDLVRQLIYAFLDNETSVGESLEIERHLETCQNCRKEAQIEANLKEEIAGSFSEIQPSATLWTKISKRLSKADRESRIGVPREWFAAFLKPAYGIVLAISIVLFIVSALWLPSFKDRSTAYPIVAETVNDHMTYLVSRRGVDVSGSDPAVISEWFRGKIDFALPLPSYDQGRYRLVGGRLCYFLDRRLVSINYEGAGHQISLYIMSGSGIQLPREDRRQLKEKEFLIARYKGYQNVIWREGESLYAAVSDMKETSLMNFVLAGTGGEVR